MQQFQPAKEQEELEQEWLFPWMAGFWMQQVQGGAGTPRALERWPESSGRGLAKQSQNQSKTTLEESQSHPG